MDHIMTPTYLDDIAMALDVLFTTNQHGIFHVVGSQSLTPHNAAVDIADHFGYDKSLITDDTREVFFQGRAPRPFNLSMSNNKIRQLGIQMKTFDEGLEAIKAFNAGQTQNTQ
jgi:dTDP-4-dehydrorhamnose reductase